MFKKIEMWILLLTMLIGLIIVIAFSAGVRHHLQGGQRLGDIGILMEQVASIPQTIKEIFEGRGSKFDLLAREQRFYPHKGFDFKFKTGAENDFGYLLLNRYDSDKGYSVSELWDIGMQDKVHTWHFNTVNSLWEETSLEIPGGELSIDLATERYRNQHSFLDISGKIFVGEGPLISIDLDSSKKIINDDFFFHHSLEADSNGDLWAPITIYPSDYNLGHGTFHDNGIAKISIDGVVKFKKSIIEILDENNLGHLIFGAGEHNSRNNDPIHLNDIEPVLKDGKNWREGDVFLSIRNLSLVVLYRPSKNKIIWFKQGPWLHQHDVNIISENEISVFDNNVKLDSKDFVVDGHNKFIVYDFELDKITSPLEDQFKELDIRTITEGRGKSLPYGTFVEESDYGRLLFLTKEKKPLWTYVNRGNDGNIYRVNWSRILTKSYGDKVKRNILNFKKFQLQQ